MDEKGEIGAKPRFASHCLTIQPRLFPEWEREMERRGRSLLDRDDEKSQHEMQEHLRMAANSHIPAAVRVVEMPVDALYAGAVAEAHLLRGDDARETSRKYQPPPLAENLSKCYNIKI